MKIKKYAAIDIGSNAVRILVTNVVSYKKKTVFLKNALVRVPIRLGQDAFTNGNISDKNIKRMIKSMKAFKLLMEVHGVKDYLAFATSALRDAKNGSYLVEKVLKKSGIKIEIIDGKKEAKIISNTNVFDTINKEKTFLYVDIGGGSTELSFIQNGKKTLSRSFNIGTVRDLSKKTKTNVWDQIKIWIKDNMDKDFKLRLFGTGGNINKIQNITNTKVGKPISYFSMITLLNNLSKIDYEKRILQYDLNPD